jgi:hypothetical protein
MNGSDLHQNYDSFNYESSLYQGLSLGTVGQ